MADMLRLSVPAWAIELDLKQTRTVLRQAGQEIAALARSKIRSAVGTGKLLGKGGKPVSRPGESPVSQTGALAGAIAVTQKGLSASITDKIGFALMLEAGAVGGGQQAGMPKGIGASNARVSRNGQKSIVKVNGSRVLQPRPFLSAALDELSEGLTTRIGRALMDGIDFKPVK